jgi:hypothetical protein
MCHRLQLQVGEGHFDFSDSQSDANLNDDQKKVLDLVLGRKNVFYTGPGSS